MSASSQSTDQPFRVGDIFARVFAVIGRSYRQFLLPVAIVMLPYIGVDWLQSRESTLEPGIVVRYFLVLPTISNTIIGSLADAVIVFGVFSSLRGRPLGLKISVATGMASIVPVMAISLLQSVLATPYYATVMSPYLFPISPDEPLVPLALLLLNGLWLFTGALWYVASAVCIIERLGPITSLRRSARLTKGHRWKILAIIVGIEVAATLLDTALTWSVGSHFGMAGLIASQYVYQTVYAIFVSVLGVAVYDRLRLVKEGIDTDQVAAVFA